MNVPLLRLFVYGSLKRGFNNHDIYCRGVRSIETAHVAGKLYRMPSGYPALELPASRVLARGSGDLVADVEAQWQLQSMASPAAALSTDAAPLGQGRVHGELLTFADPVDRLRFIDGLEEFHPGRNSRYERVLILAHSRTQQAEVPAWTYIAGPLSTKRCWIPTGRWTGRSSRTA